MVGNALALLNANAYPQRKYSDDNLGGYLARIQADPLSPSRLRQSALDIKHIGAIIEQLGITAGARAHSAFETALDLYAPRSQATEQP